MQYRRAVPVLALLALAACSDQPPQPRASDPHAIFQHLTIANVGGAHNLAVGEIGQILHKRGYERQAPEAQLAMLKTVMTDYLTNVAGVAGVIGFRDAKALVQQEVNDNIWWAGPTGRFWAFRQGAGASSPPPRAIQSLPDSEDAAVQGWHAQLSRILLDSTRSTSQKVSSINALDYAAAQSLSIPDDSMFHMEAMQSDSSLTYWQAQADSAAAGASTQPWASNLAKAIPTAPGALAVGPQRVALGWFSHLMSRLGTIGWADLAGGVTGWALCAQVVICAVTGPNAIIMSYMAGAVGMSVGAALVS